MIISVWDDEYGISVNNSYQTTKSSISKALHGFKRTNRIKVLKFIPLTDGIINL